MMKHFHLFRLLLSFNLLALSLAFSLLPALSQAQSAQRIEAVRMIQEGDNNIQLARFNDAIFSYTNAITTDPTYAEAYMKRASILQRLGRYSEAKQDMEKAKQMNPYSAYVMDGNAKLNFISADYAKGLEEVEAALRLDPENTSFLDHRADGYILSGEYEEAMEDIEALLQRSYHLDLTYLKQGLVYFLAGKMVRRTRHDSPAQ